MTIDTLVGAKTKIKGDITFSGGFRVDGHVIGTVVAEGGPDAVLMISDQGSVEGEVRAPHVIINGSMKGNVIASERVELAAQARVVGNVHYKVLEMAAGAQITGSVVREDDIRKQLPKPEARVAPEVLQLDVGESAMHTRVELKERSKVDAKRT